MSIVRALERFKTVIRRRGARKRAQSEDEVVLAALAAREEATATATAAVEKASNAKVPMVVESQSLVTTEIEATKDETTPGIEVDDVNQDDDIPIFPVDNGPYRIGISEEKAKLLFDRYGLTYQPRPAQEPPSKVRRVEKSIRLRMHWSCHECNSVFASERTCASCGHRRCQQCTRTPPQRVRQVSDHVQRLKEADEAQDAILATTSEPIPIASRNDAVASTSATDSCTRPSPGLKADSNRTTVTSDPSSFLFTFQSSRHGGLQMVHESRATLVERTCHECLTPMLPAGRPDCQACGHIRCNRCTRGVHKSRNLNYAIAGNSKAKAAPVLERVYKKPRQRIRWTCDQCQEPFRERDRCSACNHDRCEDCIRDP